ncbi:MAG TPA: TauD/TfdA family dioxygenase [Kofleriaceae bacterium]
MRRRRAQSCGLADVRELPLNVIAAEPGQALDRVDHATIRSVFERDGFVILRGFSPTPGSLIELTDRFTAKYFLGYGRSPFADKPAITTVNESMLPLEPHCDNGVRPEAMRPEITWFWCERPSNEGGETTFFDGISVLAGLSAESRALFERHEIVFTSTVAPPAWRQMGHPNAASFVAYLPTIGARGVVRAGDIVDVEIATRSIRTPRWKPSALAFVSSLLVAGSPGFEAMRVALDDGTPVPASAISDLRSVLETCRFAVAWQPGDLGMLDNTRYLHGRRGYTDRERRLFLVQTLQASI